MQIWEMKTIPNGWVKHFEDGSTETGGDADVANGRASWTRGKREGITAVSLSTAQTTIYLTTDDGRPGKFWQSDDYEVTVGQNTPTLVRRRLQLKVGDKSWKTIELDVTTHDINEYISKHKI